MPNTEPVLSAKKQTPLSLSLLRKGPLLNYDRNQRFTVKWYFISVNTKTGKRASAMELLTFGTR